mmetsp:Transcript_56325/g.174776  ORF Transcript_56325/g.174776 Transcript_56325/m.174776 type:complete len:109 (-) Transcript_56325:6-332(-)
MCFSRETLRQNKVLRIRKNLVFHCLDKFDELAEKRDDYQKFHDQFGKLSVHEERHILRVITKNLDKKCSEAFAEIAEMWDGNKNVYEQFGNCLKLGVQGGRRIEAHTN